MGSGYKFSLLLVSPATYLEFLPPSSPSQRPWDGGTGFIGEQGPQLAPSPPHPAEDVWGHVLPHGTFLMFSVLIFSASEFRIKFYDQSKIV